jgi:hypothetical protein
MDQPYRYAAYPGPQPVVIDVEDKEDVAAEIGETAIAAVFP